MKFLILSLLFSAFVADDIANNVKRIREAVSSDPKHKHQAYERMAYIVDTFGPRMWGSAPENAAINYLHQEIQKMGFDDVQLEQLTPFKTWQRGEESLYLLDPRRRMQKLAVIGLGLSEPGVVEAEVVVVRSFAELDSLKDQVKDKIVCYNIPWSNYDTMRPYRSFGPDKASAYGAKAVLLRSISSFSINSPHTGSTKYSGEFPKIPAAAITQEDSEMLQRIFDRKQKLKVKLTLNSSWKENAVSYNLIAELKGSEKPEEILLLGGHSDSWDTGSQTGAMDDMGGVTVTLEALRVIKELGIKPKRTIRFIAWSGEEMGQPDKGAFQYAEKHKDDKHVLALENDLGNLQAVGFGFTGKLEASRFIRRLVREYIPDLDNITENDGAMVDTEPLGAMGVPLMRNKVKDTKNDDYYFVYHHSNGDSVSVMDPDEMDSNVAAIASLFYIVADTAESIPK